jgi:hypothetical protein
MLPHSITVPDDPDKKCRKCRKWKPARHPFFALTRHSQDGLSTWCVECLERKRAEIDRRDAAMLEQIENDRKNRYAGLTPDERVEKARAFWAKTEDERSAERNLEWRLKRNKGERQRKARVRTSKTSHAPDFAEQQYKAQKGKCYYCKKKLGKVYHMDHVVPVSRGGSSGPENLVCACPRCNHSKNNRLPHEWPQGGRLL